MLYNFLEQVKYYSRIYWLFFALSKNPERLSVALSLKITQKVSFDKIASEARYLSSNIMIYVQKFLKVRLVLVVFSINLAATATQ